MHPNAIIIEINFKKDFDCVSGPAPRKGEGHSGAVPLQMTACTPKQKLCPPKRRLCPEEINRLGATGVQIEAQIGVCQHYFCNFCGLTPEFMTFLR